MPQTTRAISAALLLSLALAGTASRAHAQGLEDSLKQHVKEGIEKRKKGDDDKKSDDKKADGKKSDDKPAAPDDGKKGDDDSNTLFSFSTDDPDEPDEAGDAEDAQAAEDGAGAEDGEASDPKKKKKKLPVRVFGKDFKLDIKFGGGVRGWFPQQYDAVDVDFANYYTFNIDVKAKIYRFLNLRRGYVESNSIRGPKTDEAATAAEIGNYAPKALWLLGVIGVPITKAWEPEIRYEARSFETRAKRRAGVDTVVCVIPRDVDPDIECPDASLDTLAGPDDRLKIVSSFETFVAGVRYDHSKSGAIVVGDRRKGKIPPLFFGVGLMSYRKPYQLTIGTETLEENLFDGRFRGAGLALGTELGGGLDSFFSDIDMQVGLGEVSLTDDLTLNEILNDVFPNEFLVGYVQGTATLGYRLPLIRAAPTLIFVPQVKAGGASFFLIDTDVDENEEATSPTVNWDFLWTVQASLLIPL